MRKTKGRNDDNLGRTSKQERSEETSQQLSERDGKEKK
jgi:hypothetical protein